MMVSLTDCYNIFMCLLEHRVPVVVVYERKDSFVPVVYLMALVVMLTSSCGDDSGNSLS